MANKAKPTKKKTSTKAASTSNGNVVRIKADSASKKTKVETSAPSVNTEKVEKPKKVKKARSGLRGLGAFRAIGSYFKGAWVELRQVRWPTRRATWSLTAAVLLYSAFFVALILLLDAGFKYLFELILGK